MRRRVLVTRPEPAEAATARRLAALGFEPVLLPLTQTRPLLVAVGELLESRIGGVAVTSANGVRHASPELVAALAHLPCHAVGQKTARAAMAAGFAAVHEGPGDAGGLAAAMATEFAGRTIVYLCGRVRLAGFEQALAAAGAGVFPIETYDTIAVEYDDDAVAARFGDRPVDAVLLYSAKAAGIVHQLAHRRALAHLFRDATFLCLSRRVASAFPSVDGEKIRISPEPNEEALLGLLPA
ncbi:MAG: uroporphyrinogen-III synthase [Mesorhizobium sp.]